MRAKMPYMNHHEFGKIVRNQWKDLDPQKKKLYQDQVDQDITRYDKELIQYNEENVRRSHAPWRKEIK